MPTTKWNVTHHNRKDMPAKLGEMSVDAKRKEKDRKRRKEAKKQQRRNKP